MTSPLDEKARDAALAAWFANTAQGWHAAMEAAIRAYLAASPSPSMEMEERFPHSGMTTAEAVALIDSNTISGLRIRLEAAEEAENEAKDCFWAIYPRYLELGGEPVSTEAARTNLSAQVLRLTEENEALIAARNENAKLKGQRDAALARIKALEEAQEPALEHIEGLLELLKVIKDHWIDYDHVFSIAVHEAEDFLARSALKENAL